MVRTLKTRQRTTTGSRLRRRSVCAVLALRGTGAFERSYAMRPDRSLGGSLLTTNIKPNFVLERFVLGQIVQPHAHVDVHREVCNCVGRSGGGVGV